MSFYIHNNTLPVYLFLKFRNITIQHFYYSFRLLVSAYGVYVIIFIISFRRNHEFIKYCLQIPVIMMYRQAAERYVRLYVFINNITPLISSQKSEVHEALPSNNSDVPFFMSFYIIYVTIRYRYIGSENSVLL